MTQEELILNYAELKKENEQLKADMKKIEKYEQAMEEILAEINTLNRGTCDYYIVDQIENIINELRKEVL